MAYQPFDLSGKVALVTGGSAGIGLGMAKAVAQAGADVAIWGTNQERIDAARKELEATGRRILALRCDVGDEAAVEAGFDQDGDDDFGVVAGGEAHEPAVILHFAGEGCV